LLNIHKSIMTFSRKSILYHFVLLSGSFLLQNCAQIVAPSGGPKDETPPKVVNFIPENKTTNFNKKQILIKFDEYIQLKEANEKVIISPTINKKPEIIVNGKNIEINFEELLPIGKTYTFNFSDAVSDINEGNIIDGLKYVVSTADYIDSNSILGTINNAFDNSPQANISVAIYPQNTFNDSTIYNTVAPYFSKSNTDGKFFIENIPVDTFVIVAFNDENKDLKYTPGEKLAFQHNKLFSNDLNNNSAVLQLFKPLIYYHERLLDTFNREENKYIFIIYKPVTFKVTPLNKIKHYKQIKTGNNHIDTLIIFIPGKPLDSMQFEIFHQDSNKIITIRKAYELLKTPPFKFNAKESMELNDTFLLIFSNPIDSIKPKSIRIFEDTSELTFFKYNLDTISKTQIRFIKNWNEATNYKILISDSSIWDIYGNTNRVFEHVFITKSLKDYGNLILNVNVKDSSQNYILQLVEEKTDLVIKQQILSKTTTYSFKYLNPMNIRVKVIIDANKNNEWDSGDYFKHLLPEKIHYYESTFLIKAQWDLEQTISIDSIISD